MRPNLKLIETLKDDAIFTMTEAGKFLGITAAGIRNWGIKGRIKLVKIGGRYFVQGSELRKAVK